MLIPYKQIFDKYKMNVKGILHIGAHECEELNDYLEKGLSIDKIFWIEGNPKIASKMKKLNKNLVIHNYLISDVNNEEVIFNISNNGQSSSILELGTHLKHHPHIHYCDKMKLHTTRIDAIYENENIDEKFANFLNIDIQGYELKALKGMGDLLKNFDYLYLEVNKEYVYENGCLVGEIDEYVNNFGFKRVETKWCGNYGWGDALYIKSITPTGI